MGSERLSDFPKVTELDKGICTHQMDFKTPALGTSLMVQWLRLHAPNAGGLGSIPGPGTRSHMHATTKEPTCHN